MKKYALPLILMLALLFRVFMLLTTLQPIISDEAATGLMAQHIRHGARPLFDYGIRYHGPLESYLTAPLFAVFGMNRIVLRIVPLGFSIVFVGAIYWLGSKLYGRTIGLMSALYAAVPPSMLTIWGLRAGAGYIVVLALGTMSLVLAADLRRKANAAKLLVLLLLLALSFWVLYVTGYYIAALVLAAGIKIAWQRPSLSSTLSPRARIAGGALAAVALFVVCYVLSLLPIMPSLADSFHRLVGLVTLALPVLLGFWQPSVDPQFASQMAAQGAIYALGIGLSAVMCLIVLWIGVQQLGRGDILLPLFIAVTVLLFATFFVVGRVSFVLLSEPRYLLPLYSAIPLAMLALFRLTQKTPRLRLALLGGLLVLNLYSNLSIKPPLVDRHRVLVNWLDEHDVRHVYADYWTSYCLAFESQERIVPFTIGPGNQVGWNRYQPYVAEVESSPDPAVIFLAGSEEEQAFASYLTARNIRCEAQSIAGYTVYWNLSRRVHFPLER
jgi:hypothetical protein